MELDALDSIIKGAGRLAKEAAERTADLKQARVESEAYGRANSALKTKLSYRLNSLRIIELEARLVEGKTQDEPKAIEQQKAA
jgi:hypothetical protein